MKFTEEEIKRYLDDTFSKALNQYVNPFLTKERKQLSEDWFNGQFRNGLVKLLTENQSEVQKDNTRKLIVDKVRQHKPTTTTTNHCPGSQTMLSLPSGDAQLDICGVFKDLKRDYRYEYVSEVKRILNNAAKEIPSKVSEVYIHEIIYRINQTLMKLKETKYSRFYYQIWMDVSDDCVKTQIFDPYERLSEEESVFRIPIHCCDSRVEDEETFYNSLDEMLGNNPADTDVSIDDPSIFSESTIEKSLQSHTGRSREDMLQVKLTILTVFKLFADHGLEKIGISIPSTFAGEDIASKALIRHMASAGWLIKYVDPKNKQATTYSLSEEGLKILNKNEPITLSWSRWYHKVFDEYDYKTRVLMNSIFANPDIKIPKRDFDEYGKVRRRLLAYGIFELVDENIVLTDLGKVIATCYNEEVCTYYAK